jgi:hypothetical protein
VLLQSAQAHLAFITTRDIPLPAQSAASRAVMGVLLKHRAPVTPTVRCARRAPRAGGCACLRFMQWLSRSMRRKGCRRGC